MRKIAVLLLGALSLCSSVLDAQESAGQGWGVSAPRQRSSSTISMAATGSRDDAVRPITGTFSPAAGRNESGRDPLPPFPVLMPKAIVYPRQAVRRGWEGQAVVAAEVLPDGSVGRMALAKSSGHAVLDQAAQEAVQSWKFKTESEQDAAVPQFVDIPVTFKLRHEDLS